MTTELTRRRFTVDEYHKMAEAGILCEDDRVELLDGEVVQMPPTGPGHASKVNRMHPLFGRMFGDVAVVWVQTPIRLDQHSEPEPDVALLRLRADFYESSLPTPPDIFLIIEVSDSTSAYDRRAKARLYAQAGIADYWIHDVQQRTLTVLRDPGPDGYRSEQTLRRGDRIAPLAFPDRELAVSEVLGE